MSWNWSPKTHNFIDVQLYIYFWRLKVLKKCQRQFGQPPPPPLPVWVVPKRKGVFFWDGFPKVKLMYYLYTFRFSEKKNDCGLGSISWSVDLSMGTWWTNRQRQKDREHEYLRCCSWHRRRLCAWREWGGWRWGRWSFVRCRTCHTEITNHPSGLIIGDDELDLEMSRCLWCSFLLFFFYLSH